MVKAAGNIIMNAYAALIIVVLIVGPLIILRGYHQGWVIIFYAGFFAGAIGGIVARYTPLGRSRKS
jgi:hypothetical protein